MGRGRLLIRRVFLQMRHYFGPCAVKSADNQAERLRIPEGAAAAGMTASGMTAAGMDSEGTASAGKAAAWTSSERTGCEGRSYEGIRSSRAGTSRNMRDSSPGVNPSASSSPA